MTRAHLQRLTKLRLMEVRLLLRNKNYSGAYYLAGYLVEYALKACISRRIRKSDVPEKKFMLEFYTHNLKDLVKLANLENSRIQMEETNTSFASNWTAVKDWNESSRYKIFTKEDAEKLYISITSKNGGILSWIQQYW